MQPERDLRVVVQERRHLAAAGAVRPPEAAVRVRQRAEQERGAALGGGEQVGPPAQARRPRPARPGPCRSSSRAPCRRARAAGGAARAVEQWLAHARERARASASSSGGATSESTVAPSKLPSSVTPHVFSASSASSAREHGAELRGRPRERRALDAVGVGVLRRGEAAVLERELAQEVVEDALRDLAPLLVAGHLPGREVRAREQRVVVEHLLEVRHEPDRVDRIAVEAAAELVVDPAVGHAPQRAQRHRERLLAAAAAVHAEQERRAPSAAGTWARAPKPPLRSSCCPRSVSRASRSVASLSWKPAGGRPSRPLLQARGHLRGLVLDQLAALTVGLVDALEHLAERGQAAARLGREVRPAVERARRRAAGRRSSASRPGPSERRPRSCRGRRRRGAPRDRP